MTVRMIIPNDHRSPALHRLLVFRLTVVMPVLIEHGWVALFKSAGSKLAGSPLIPTEEG